MGAGRGRWRGTVRYPLLLRELNGSSPASAEMQIYTHPPYQQPEDAQSANAPAGPSQGHRRPPEAILPCDWRPTAETSVAAHIRLSRAGPPMKTEWWSWAIQLVQASVSPANNHYAFSLFCPLRLVARPHPRSTLALLQHCNLSRCPHGGGTYDERCADDLDPSIGIRNGRASPPGGVQSEPCSLHTPHSLILFSLSCPGTDPGPCSPVLCFSRPPWPSARPSPSVAWPPPAPWTAP